MSILSKHILKIYINVKYCMICIRKDFLIQFLNKILRGSNYCKICIFSCISYKCISISFFFFFFSESLIRTAFQCLQLVVTDFLPTMPCTCLQIVVDVAGSFGLHNQELNISLTSIGLLVSIIAFLII